MNSLSAKQILIACRPGTSDLESAEARAALEQAERDPELQQWWRQQHAFHRSMGDAFRQAPVPADLRDEILGRIRIVELPWWRKPIAFGAAAAVIVLLINMAVFWKSAPADALPTFRSRMVGNVLRQYAMDIETNDMRAIRQFLGTAGAPSDYKLPLGLARRPPLGAGVLSWQDRRVSMVCLDSQSQGTLFLFVVDDPALRAAGAQPQQYAAVHDLMTVSWTEGTNTYLLAGHGGKEWLAKQLLGAE
jgi:hypothetical protein